MSFTHHALQQMQRRGIGRAAVQACLDEGRQALCRGAVLYAVGHREVAAARRLGRRIEGLMGLHVVCAHDGAVLTAYRNRRGLRLRHSDYKRVVIDRSSLGLEASELERAA
jgi:hypothetical protein